MWKELVCKLFHKSWHIYYNPPFAGLHDAKRVYYNYRCKKCERIWLKE